MICTGIRSVRMIIMCTVCCLCKQRLSSLYPLPLLRTHRTSMPCFIIYPKPLSYPRTPDPLVNYEDGGRRAIVRSCLSTNVVFMKRTERVTARIIFVPSTYPSIAIDILHDSYALSTVSLQTQRQTTSTPIRTPETYVDLISFKRSTSQLAPNQISGF